MPKKLRESEIMKRIIFILTQVHFSKLQGIAEMGIICRIRHCSQLIYLATELSYMKDSNALLAQMC